ncbi:MAG: hypothetical protein MI806_26535 [Minwuiales bacterium]|nr:hypothetical protein [Minwuiales bacterium]
MTAHPIAFTLSYSGALADDQEIDLYDVGQALIGFQRSLALTTHLILNNKIITQAPSLKGARVIALPPEDGSWRFTAAIVSLVGGVYALGTAPKDTPVGHLIRSAYDYVVSETLGFHVDYDKTLGQQYEELKKRNPDIQSLPQWRFDSLTEKCEAAIKDMHRPIVWSKTATKAEIISRVGSDEHPFEHPLDQETFEYIHVTQMSETAFEFVGRVSSYNINTFKGRLYIEDERRPIPFELAPSARDVRGIACVTESLSANAQTRFRDDGNIRIVAFPSTSKSGRLKSLLIVKASR